MLLTYPTLIILTLVSVALIWWWRVHGRRDYVLHAVKAHCNKLHLTLLDDYVALKKMAIQRDRQHRLRFTYLYNFEFTVTGEHRYTGTITLIGYQIDRIDLPPYPFNSTQASSIHVTSKKQSYLPAANEDFYEHND